MGVSNPESWIAETVSSGSDSGFRYNRIRFHVCLSLLQVEPRCHYQRDEGANTGTSYPEAPCFFTQQRLPVAQLSARVMRCRLESILTLKHLGAHLAQTIGSCIQLMNKGTHRKPSLDQQFGNVTACGTLSSLPRRPVISIGWDMLLFLPFVNRKLLVDAARQMRCSPLLNHRGNAFAERRGSRIQ
jgi:hypothetical protein